MSDSRILIFARVTAQNAYARTRLSEYSGQADIAWRNGFQWRNGNTWGGERTEPIAWRNGFRWRDGNAWGGMRVVSTAPSYQTIGEVARVNI